MKTTHHTGLSVEDALIDYCDWRASSKEDNIHKDIDAWDRDNVSYSIKYQPTCLRTGNIALETTLIDPRTDESIPSWFHVGEAEKYAFVIGREVFEFDKKEMREWVIAQNAKDKFRKTKLTNSDRIASNVGRKYSQSVCLLIPLSRLIEDKIVSARYALDDYFTSLLK